jgi:hypothetical protein
MKKLLLAAFLLTAGMITSEKANAQKENKATQLPKKVVDEFEAIRANDESIGFTYTSIKWVKTKNVFTVSVVISHPDFGVMPVVASWNSKGELIE